MKTSILRCHRRRSGLSGGGLNGRDPQHFEGLFQRSDHSHRARDERILSAWSDPFKPRTTDGLSSNRNACASYGCVGAGGGGD